ncbi:hypothetical protein [Mucilaginibacter terrae]|uniref:Uncharacterized protein n=1 Tax=Mucilaginibacter terrae TaxID=1955052 RepID=A0ABU3GRU7_9SPHI|nr:hypothetical protein [Mucilaginibacter terrae]MDT3402492.1 hypothetical protein [Mucilaginibacter terrae]
MKLLKVVLIIFVTFVMVSAVLILINRLRSKGLNKQYTTLGTKVESKHFTMEEFKVAGRTFVLQSEDNLHPDPLQESDALSYLRYDKVNRQIILQTEEYVSSTSGQPVNDTRIHQYCFDMDGKLVSHDSAIYHMAQSRKSIVLKDYIAPFQKWKDDKQEIYLRHFGIESFSGECLNPFSIGGINGSSPCYVWDGSGYFNLKIAGDTLRFKSPAGKADVFFTEKHDYGTDLSYYELPKVLGLQTPAFILYRPNYGQHRIFIIKRKS